MIPVLLIGGGAYLIYDALVKKKPSFDPLDYGLPTKGFRGYRKGSTHYAKGGEIKTYKDFKTKLIELANQESDRNSFAQKVKSDLKKYIPVYFSESRRDILNVKDDQYKLYMTKPGQYIKELNSINWESIYDKLKGNYAKGGIYGTGKTSKKEIISAIKQYQATIKDKEELKEELKSKDISDFEIDLIENKKLPDLVERENVLHTQISFLLKKYGMENDYKPFEMNKGLYSFMKEQGFKDGGEVKMENGGLIGKRIRLIKMENDPNPVEPGTMGTIKHVGGGVYNVDWDNGRRLGVVEGEDEFEIVN